MKTKMEKKEKCICPHDYKSLKLYIGEIEERVTEIIKYDPQTASYIYNSFLLVDRILRNIEHTLDNNLRERSAEDMINIKNNIQLHSGCPAIKHRRKFKKK